jgi:hypothetical protein
MWLKKSIEVLATVALIGGFTAFCHQKTATAAATDSNSYETDCIENTCSTAEIDFYHDAYEDRSIDNWNARNLEEDRELASNRVVSQKKERSCSAATMMTDFIVRLNTNVDTDDLLYHEWICLHP